MDTGEGGELPGADVMSAEMTLRQFYPTRPTHLVFDASPKAIPASVYQETKDGTWEPVDLVDRALSAVEEGWHSRAQRDNIRSQTIHSKGTAYAITKYQTFINKYGIVCPFQRAFGNRRRTAYHIL